MPTRFAIANGNWSSASIWDSNSLPTSADDVYANGFTVNINQNINVLTLRNTASPVIIPNIATPIMTANNLPSGIASGSTTNGSNFAYLAFDQSLSTAWYTTTNNTGTLTYQFPSSITVKRYTFYNAVTGNSPRSWTFEGSNDGINWVVLDTQVNIPISAPMWWTSTLLANTTAYLYYRMNVTAAQSNTFVAIFELQMTESTGSVFGGVTGGTFNLGNGVTATCTAASALIPGPANSPVVTFNLATGSSASFVGAISSQNNDNVYSLLHNSGGTLNIVGNLSGAGNRNNFVFNMTGTGIMNITGNLTSTHAGFNASPFRIFGTGTVNITGDVFGSPNAGALEYTIELSNFACRLNVVGNLYASSQQCINSSGASIVNVTGNIVASNATAAIQSTSTAATIIASGNLINTNGRMAINSPTLFLGNTGPQYWDFTTSNLLVNRRIYTADTLLGVPVAANVRSGTTYGAGSSLTGTLIMATPSNVRMGVPTDNTVGTAQLTAQDILTEIATSSDPTAVRLRNVSTVQISGDQIAAASTL